MKIATVTKSATSLFCAIVALLNSVDLMGTEFGGGQLTGFLVHFCFCGGILFLFCAILTFSKWKITAVLCAMAAVICLPLYLYLIAPGSLQWLSSSPSSASNPDHLTLNVWAIAGLLSLVAVFFAYLRPLGKLSGISVSVRNHLERLRFVVIR